MRIFGCPFCPGYLTKDQYTETFKCASFEHPNVVFSISFAKRFLTGEVLLTGTFVDIKGKYCIVLSGSELMRYISHLSFPNNWWDHPPFVVPGVSYLDMDWSSLAAFVRCADTILAFS